MKNYFFSCLIIVFALKTNAQINPICFNTFTSSLSYGSSVKICSGDFNSDGNNDLAIANYTSVPNSSVTVLLGSGNGSFVIGNTYSVNNAYIGCIEASDLNADGKLDLVMGSYSSNGISIMLGTGPGTFSTAVNYASGSGCTKLVTSDFNLDGILDFAITNYLSNGVSIYRGLGPGTFSSAVTYTLTNPDQLCVADFNNDGNKDLALTSAAITNTIFVFNGSSTGTFAPANTYASPSSGPIYASDFNSDGKPDLATSSATLTTVLLNNGIGSFTNSATYTVAPGSSFSGLGDFNGDTYTDLGLFNISSNIISCLLGSATGTFGLSTYYGGSGGGIAHITNINNDSRIDVINYYNSVLNVWVGTPAPVFTLNPLPTSICSGQSTSITASGPFTYTWSTGATTNSIVASPTVTSNYTMTGTSLGGCRNSATVGIIVNPNPTLTVNSGSICSGNSFTIIPSGALTYTYSGGSNIVSPAINTSYSVTGTSAAGCVSGSAGVSTVVVNLTPTVGVISGSICSGSSFTFTPSGAVTYTYSSGSNIVSPLSTNNYSIIGTSAAGCISSNTAVSTVSVNATPTLSANSGSICLGQSYTLVAAGASSYTWNPGALTGSSVIVSPLVSTSYSVFGSSSGCTSNTTQTLLVNSNPTLTVNSGSICSGNSFTIIPSGASTYTYSGGSNIVSPAINTSYSVTGTSTAGCVSGSAVVSTVVVNLTPTLSVNSGSICSGNSFTIVPSGASTYTYSGGSNIVSPVSTTIYSITGTSAAGCVSSNTAVSTVSVNATPTLSANSGSICFGQSFTLVAAGASSYTWNPGALTGSSVIVSPLVSTNYSVFGSSSGCASNITQTLVVNSNPVVSVNSGSICSGTSYTLIPSGALTYTYSGGSNIVSPASTSNYSVTGTSTNGCISSNTAVSTVTVFATPTLAVNSGSICSGQNFTLIPSGANTYTYSGGSNVVSPGTSTNYSVVGTSTAGCVSGNTAVATVTVYLTPTLAVNSGSICSNNSFTIIPSGANTYTINGNNFIVSPITTTNYSVTGTSTAGCISSNTAVSTVTVFATPTLAVNSGSICNGQSFTLVPSGANTYTYSGGSSIISPASTTNYSVTGTSTAGCVSGNTAVATVTVYAIPTVAVNSGSICSNDSFTLVPTGANTYTISGNNFTVSPINTTNYSVTGTSSAGCVSNNTAVSTVTVFATPTLAVNSGSICSGQTLVLTASGANTYSWNAVANSFSLSVNPNTSTSYSVTGTSTDGCVAANTAVSSVTVEATPTISVNSGSICSGDSFTLSPSGAFTYTFSSGSNIVNPTLTTSYSVSGTSTTGCISSSTAVSTITVIALPTVSINATNTFVCQGLSATLTASGANTYTWNTGSGNAALSVTPAITTNYSVLATALSGCTNTAVQSVSVNALTNLLGSVTSTAGNVTGIVILYKKSSVNGQWDSISNVAINTSAYAFNAIPSASYAVLAVPTQTDLLETYGSSSSSWQGATIISHSCISNSTENINVVPILNIGTGPGSMSGQITEGPGFGSKTSETSAGNPIGGISVKGGKNPGGNVVGRTKTNANGDYVLDSLPANGPGESYFILVDIPGLDTNNTYHRIILVGSENYTNLDFVVDSAKINPVDLTVGVKELTLENGKLLVFPNPSKGQLNVNFTLLKSTEISIDLTDLSGRVIKAILSSVKQDKGEVSVRALLNDINPGVYFVRMNVGDEQRVTKWVVTE